MNGLKPVRARRDDALTQVDWKQLEVLLAVYYRGQGYAVEHVGTGATGARSDGGIDLKLRRNDEYVLVQVKHWNAYQVPHNDVHQLLGLVVNEGATGAVLVTSGEFTKAAIEAATRQGHVQLIDGGELRALLGPLLVGAEAPRKPMVRRLLDAAEDRIRYGRSGRPNARSAAATGLNLLLIKMALGLVSIGVIWLAFQFAMGTIQSALTPRQTPTPATSAAPVLPAPTGAPRLMSAAGEAHAASAAEVLPPREPTAAEIRESQRRADEAMRVIEATTPEM